MFFASAVYDSHSYAGEYVEMQLGDRNQQAAELLSVQQKNGNSFGVCYYFYIFQFLMHRTVVNVFENLLNKTEHLVVPLLSGFVVVALSVAAVIHIWFLIVVVQCAQYLRDMRPFKVSKYRLLIFVLFFSLFCLIGY